MRPGNISNETRDGSKPKKKPINRDLVRLIEILNGRKYSNSKMIEL